MSGRANETRSAFLPCGGIPEERATPIPRVPLVLDEGIRMNALQLGIDEAAKRGRLLGITPRKSGRTVPEMTTEVNQNLLGVSIAFPSD